VTAWTRANVAVEWSIDTAPFVAEMELCHESFGLFFGEREFMIPLVPFEREHIRLCVEL
jgi:hypothetical protein